MFKILKMIFFLALVAASYYATPEVLKMFPQAADWGMFVTIMFIPACCLFLSLLYGLTKKSSLIIYPLLCGAIFIPAIFIYYNSSAWFYCLVYVGIALIGVAVGKFISLLVRK